LIASTATIPLTQDFLSQMLSVRRTTVTIAAQLLQSAGLMRYRRGLIQILDRAGLEDLCCECYAAVQHNVDKVFPARSTNKTGYWQTAPRDASNQMSEQPIQDVNEGKPWSEMDLFDLRWTNYLEN
jgi:Crp-like helix-turn-helix domain